MQACTERQRVLRNFVSRDVRQLGNRKRAKLHAAGGSARLNRVRVINTRGARSEQLQVAIHGVLVQGNEQVHAVAHVGDLFGARSNRQESVAAADNGLIGVVGV